MNRSLKGLRVLNTRPKEQARELSQQIHNAGGIAVDLPTLEIQELHDWYQYLPDLQQIDQAIFVSANAVGSCMSQIKKWPTTIQVIAIGEGSAKALRQKHIHVANIPKAADSEHLLTLESLQQPDGQNILLFKGKGGRALIEETLKNRGANLTALDVYQRILPQKNHQFIKSIWRDDLVDIILLTSEQSIRHLFELFDEEAHDWIRHKTCLVLSNRLAQIAAAAGIKNSIISTPDGIMNALFDSVIKD